MLERNARQNKPNQGGSVGELVHRQRGKTAQLNRTALVLLRSLVSVSVLCAQFCLFDKINLGSLYLSAPLKPVQKTVGRCTSGTCFEIRLEAHRPTLFYTGARGAGKLNGPTIYSFIFHAIW
ncbi:unnamed protein product [Ixodes pacificus]